MKDLSLALRVGITVRSYLQESDLQQPVDYRKVAANQERICKQIRQVVPIE